MNACPSARPTFYLRPPPVPRPVWQFTDDTQLTLVTLEALSQTPTLSAATLAPYLVQAFSRGQFTGLGASTQHALQQLQAGGHWSQVGRLGEYGAGNGAAMRLAPFAFWQQYERPQLQEFCRLTHRHEEAYVWGLAVVLAIRAILHGQWTGTEALLRLVMESIKKCGAIRLSGHLHRSRWL